jgi:hypothetical protein
MTWHVDPSMLDRYVTGNLGDSSVMSIEAHLSSCDQCRRVLPDTLEPDRLERMWSAICDVVEVPSPRPAERQLWRIGVSEPTARLIVTTPAARLPWIASMFGCLLFAVVASHAVGSGAAPFLVVAPLVPVAGVAWSFSRSRDPLWEIGLATPSGGLRLTLIRSLAVLATSILCASAVSAVVPWVGWSAFGWLLPALALTSATLALSTTSVAIEMVAACVGATWVAGVLWFAHAGSLEAVVLAAPGQIFFLAVLLAATSVLIFRRDAFVAPIRATIDRGW